MKKLMTSITTLVLATSLVIPAFATLTPTIAPESGGLIINGEATTIKPCVMVPLRDVAEALGFTVTWDEENQCATVDSGKMHINVSIGLDLYVATTSIPDMVGMTAPFSCGVAPTLTNNVTYVPVEIFRPLLENKDTAIVMDGETIIINNASTVQVPNPLTAHQSLDALETAVGFTFQAPTPPVGYETTTYTDIGGTLAQVVFSKGEHLITYRVSKGTENNSGIYAEFENQEVANMAPNGVTYQGNDGAFQLAIWTNGEFVHSVYTSEPMALKALEAVVKSAV